MRNTLLRAKALHTQKTGEPSCGGCHAFASLLHDVQSLNIDEFYSKVEHTKNQESRSVAAQDNRSGAAHATAAVDLRAPSQARIVVFGMQAVMSGNAYDLRDANESGEFHAILLRHR